MRDGQQGPTLIAVFVATAMLMLAGASIAHDCQVANGYLRGAYEGGCNEKIEMASGHADAKGADHYVGDFVDGRSAT